MANPALIQKQIKDNTEDLHNFVRDLNLWEQEMKRKDRQLSNEQFDEVGLVINEENRWGGKKVVYVKNNFEVCLPHSGSE